MEKLKPCPFCGGEAELIDIGCPVYGEGRYYVVCKTGCVEQTRMWATKQTAIKRWNRRAKDE